MDSRAILIGNGLIVTGDTAGSRFEPGGLLIEGNRIAWVGPMDQVPAAVMHPQVETIYASR